MATHGEESIKDKQDEKDIIKLEDSTQVEVGHTFC